MKKYKPKEGKKHILLTERIVQNFNTHIKVLYKVEFKDNKAENIFSEEFILKNYECENIDLTLVNKDNKIELKPKYEISVEDDESHVVIYFNCSNQRCVTLNKYLKEDYVVS